MIINENELGACVQLVILGIFTGTLFYQVPNATDRSDMDLRKSLAFLAVMTLSLNTVSQIPVQLDERSVKPLNNYIIRLSGLK